MSVQLNQRWSRIVSWIIPGVVGTLLSGCLSPETMVVRRGEAGSASSGGLNQEQVLIQRRPVPLTPVTDRGDVGSTLPEIPLIPLPWKPHYPVPGPRGFANQVGLNIHHASGPFASRMVSRLKEANVGWARIDISWGLIEAINGKYDGYGSAPYGWEGTGLDETVDRLHGAGINIFASIAGTPYGYQGKPGRCLPDATHSTEWDCIRGWGANPPISNQAWSNFVFALVKRYGDRVKYFGIWNEPNVSGFFNGSGAEYDELAHLAYKAAKKANPTVKIVGPDIAMGGDFGAGAGGNDNIDHLSWDEWLFQRLANARRLGTPYDVISVHFYSPSDSLIQIMAKLKNRLLDLGHTQPLWLTETNMPDFPIVHTYEAEERHLAALLKTTRGGRIWDKLFYYQLQNDEFGVTDDELKPKPAFNALKRIMNGASYKACGAGSCTDIEGMCCANACSQSSTNFSCRAEDDRLLSNIRAFVPSLNVTVDLGSIHEQTYREGVYAGYKKERQELVHGAHGFIARSFQKFKIVMSPRYPILPYIGTRARLSLRYRSKLKGGAWGQWMSEGRFSGTDRHEEALDQVQIELTGIYSTRYDVNYKCHYEANPGAPEGQPKGTESSLVVRNGTICGKSGHEIRAIEVWVSKR